MKTRIRPSVMVLFLAVMTLLLLGLVPSAVAKNSGKQQICHRTGSSKNPWVIISPSKNAKGHTSHKEKSGRNDGKVQQGATNGPHQSNSACTPKKNPPPPVCTPPDPACSGGEPGGPPTNGGGGGPGAAPPASAIAGQPTVTG